MSKTIVETLTKETIFDKDGQVLSLCETESNGVKHVSLKQRDCINFSSTSILTYYILFLTYIQILI
jgi:hypothetical protein